jgi:hypothetical protein
MFLVKAYTEVAMVISVVQQLSLLVDIITILTEPSQICCCAPSARKGITNLFFCCCAPSAIFKTSNLNLLHNFLSS